jgi:adenine-specific DNA-methyltransferase
MASNLPEPKCAWPTGVVTDVPCCMAMVERVMAHYRDFSGRLAPATECLRLASGKGPPQVLEVLAQLAPPWADHAIAGVYAVLMPRQRRKRLGIYFTPPHLVAHLLRRMRAFGLDPAQHRLRDPSAGGAAFLVPLAREMASAWLSEGVQPGEIIARLRARLHGREIDPGLTSVANTLLRRMLVSEFRISADLVSDLSVVKVGDSLSVSDLSDGVHELSNPPYLRLDAKGQRRWKKRFGDIADGRLNLYAMFVRRALDQVAPNGLIGHVLPASFLGGPEFSAFRRRTMQLADVLVLDVVEKRKGVFLDAIQDACFIVLRRRAAPVDNPPATTVSSGVLRHSGEFVLSGHAKLSADGAPWSLPGNDPVDAAKLADYGYRATVGYLVANRQSHLLHRRPARGRLPLVWAKCITPDGLFDFDRGRNAEKAGGRGFVVVPKNAAYIIRMPCVLVQRTSSNSQSRRLTAAAVPKDFFRRYEGFVGENHVIVLIPTRADAVAPERLAAVLNGPEANAMLSRVCGSASISVRVLESLPLPRPHPGN